MKSGFGLTTQALSTGIRDIFKIIVFLNMHKQQNTPFDIPVEYDGIKNGK